MAEFLHDLNIHGAGQIQFKTAAGANGGKIDQNGNDLVLTNPAGDILLGDGAADIYIGDGTNSVDLLFEQSASIKADDSATGVTITLGSSNTTLAFGGSTDFTDTVNSFSPTGTNTIDIGTNAKPFKNIYAAHHVGGSSINYATSRGWVEDDAPLSSTQVGYYGGNFIRNGSEDENAVVWGIDPFGNKALLWKSILNQPGNNDDGGWNKDITIPANNNIGYLSYFYFKFDFTPNEASDGQFYHGCGTTAGQTINLADDSNNTNPYFNNGNIYNSNVGSAFVANRWYLTIGILQAYNNDTTDIDTMTGVYDVETGQKVRNGSEFKMGNNTTGQKHRAYIYYDTTTDANENAYFWNPGFHAIDGSEPKLQDLLKRNVSLPDNVKARFGSNSDLNIYHDGNDSRIENLTGDIVIQNETNDRDIKFRSDDGSGGTTEYFRVDGSSENVLFSRLIKLADNVELRVGDGNDLKLYHDASNSYIKQSGVGDLIIQQSIDDKDILFQSDDGSGGVETYFYLDGSGSRNVSNKNFRIIDNKLLSLGSSDDFKITHDGTNTLLTNETGTLRIINGSDDSDIEFYSDDGSGGLAKYFYLDGSQGTIRFEKNARWQDGKLATFGDSDDLQIYHDGSNSYIVDAGTGDLLTYYSNDFKVIQYGSSEVSIWARANEYVKLFYDGNEKLATTNTGITITGQLDGVTNMFLGEYLYHQGDGDTYLNFQNANEFRIVIGGSEKIHFNTSRIRINDDLHAAADSSYDIGTSSVRFANIYADTLYGDGSNITGITATDSTKVAKAGDTMTGQLVINHDDGLRLSDTANASTSRTTFKSYTSGGNSQTLIKGGNFIHTVKYETSWNDFNYALLTSSYNTGDSKFRLNKSDSSGGVDSYTEISTGASTFAGSVSATEFRPTNIVTNKVVKFNGTQLDDANITDTGSLITLGSNTVVSGELEATSLDINGNADIAGELQVTTNGTATLILRGDNNNSGDTGQLDSTIKMLHDDGTHGVLMETKNYAGKQSFEIKSLSAGTESSRFLIHQDNYITTSGDILPQTDNSKDLGSSSYRWQNVVAVNLHGDGSNITNIGNADTVDNLHASSFLRSDGSDTATGKITFSQNAATIALAGTNHTYAEFYKTGTGNGRSAYLGFGSSGNNHFNIANEISSGKVIIDTNGGSVEINDNTTISGDIQASGVYVGSTNTSYDFYNNGTSYLNGAVTIDDNLTVTGNLTITGDINSYNVTDLDVSDKTITVGVGQAENVSGGSGLKVSGPTTEPSMLWDEANDTWDFNYGIDVAGNITFGDSHFIGDDSFDNLHILASSGENVVIQAPSGNSIDLKTAGGSTLNLDSSQNATFGGDINGDKITLTQGAYTDGYRLIRSGHDTYRIALGDSQGLQIINETDSARKELIFGGDGNATFGGKVIIPQTSTTIGGSNLGNASLLLGSTTTGIGIDTNEIVSKGDHLYIGTATDGKNIIFRTDATSAALTLDSSQNATFAGQVTSGRLNITDAAVSIMLTESGNTGTGKYWRQVLDAGDIRFDVDTTSTNGDGSFSSYNALIQLNADGHTDINGALDVAGNIDANGNLDVAGNIVVAGTVDGVDISSLPTFSTVGTAFAQLGDVSVASYIRVNADETLAYLNASQFLTAIGGLPKAGGTMTGDLVMDGKSGVGNVIALATGTLSDTPSLKFYTYNNTDPGGGLGTGTGNIIQSDLGTGGLIIRQNVDNADIIFQADDGSSGVTEYFRVDGDEVRTIYTKDLKTLDNTKILIGNGADLQIYHDGSDSYIKDSGAGNLKIQGDNNVYIGSTGGEFYFRGIKDDAAVLYFNNSSKFATTSSGVAVTGNITVSGTVDGRDIATDGTKLDTIATNATANAGTVTSVTAGNGMTQSGTSTVNPTLNVVGGDGITANANDIAIDYSTGSDNLINSASTGTPTSSSTILFNDSGGVNKVALSSINISNFNNDSSFTSNTGTVTAVTVGTGLDISSGTTTPNITLDLNEITKGTGLDSTTTGLSLDFTEFTAFDSSSNTVDKIIGIDDESEETKINAGQFTYQTLTAHFSQSSGSSSTFNIPMNNTTESTTATYYHVWTPPFDGKVKTMIMKHAHGTSPSLVSAQPTKFRVAVNGTGADYTSSSFLTRVRVEGRNDDYYAYIKDDNINQSFSAGDRVYFQFLNSSSSVLWRNCSVSIVVEYNIT